MISLAERRRKREERRERLEKACCHIVKQLKALGALKIVLFGSFVRGETGLWSDLDILAVMPSSLSGKEWRKKIYAEVEREVACDFIVYNEQELEESIPVSSFLRHALKEGKLIYEKRS